jgi:hypothetical protein
MSESSFGRARYMMTFTDDYTRKTFVYFSKKRMKLKLNLKNLKGLLKMKLATRLKFLDLTMEGNMSIIFLRFLLDTWNKAPNHSAIQSTTKLIAE